jgi:glycogen operon protein
MIFLCLRHWVHNYHVDGFRFDLASILSRDEQGRPMVSPPIVWDIESDPVLANVKLIAEAWDAAGLYQVGRFVGDTAGMTGTGVFATIYGRFSRVKTEPLERWRSG